MKLFLKSLGFIFSGYSMKEKCWIYVKDEFYLNNNIQHFELILRPNYVLVNVNGVTTLEVYNHNLEAQIKIFNLVHENIAA